MRTCARIPYAAAMERAATLPTLDEMRAILRAGMPRHEFFGVLDELAERPGGLRLIGHGDKLVGVPVAEGDELLCFVDETLFYVEYRGGIFLEVAS
jgi:hypothetical protein